MNDSIGKKFMELYRNDNLHQFLTDEECREVFFGILKGQSDITPELISELKSCYDIPETETNVFVLDSSYTYDRDPNDLDDEQFVNNSTRFTQEEFEAIFSGGDPINTINSDSDYIRFITLPKIDDVPEVNE